jgi:hypothetical protein
MVVLLRAVVMLVVLVGLPAAWIYYGPLPPGAQRAVDRVLEVVKETIGPEQPVAEPNAQKAAPRYDIAAAQTRKNSSPIPSLPAALPKTAPKLAPEGLSEQVRPLLEKLRALGSTEYSLEPWGSEGDFFRFRCAMPLVAQDRQSSQQFEAVAATPQASIEQVVSEVAHWKTSH